MRLKAHQARPLTRLIIGMALMGASCSPSYKDSKHSIKGRDERDAAEPADAGETPDAVVDAGGAAGSAGAAPTQPNQPAYTCIKAKGSDKLAAREGAMQTASTAHANSSGSGVFTRDLFQQFASHCGSCHVDRPSGGLQVNLLDFPTKITSLALEKIRSEDPKFFMPPPGPTGMPFSKRGPNDPVRLFSNLLEVWLAQGRPADQFFPPSDAGSSTSVNYLLPRQVGMDMTNVGNCVPDAHTIAVEKAPADKLDEFFANAKQLPERLDQTDLLTFDAEVLARTGVVAFAPAYPLWADNAKKIRMLRVPRGQSIRFDKDAQSFVIPPNTRFYKTFLKHVIDLDGRESYRKMETRLIVSRPDTVDADGRTHHHTALFGTYAWNEQETEAVLVRDPLRNGEPFRDRLVTFITDEQKADKIIAEGSAPFGTAIAAAGLASDAKLMGLAKDLGDKPLSIGKNLELAGLTRTYAIPGSTRCVQCHQGAPTSSFILGFTPLQINRQPLGQSGVIDPAERDEMNQLQRLIDYGLITGMDSPSDAVRLENSQGSRKPRNEHELEAQGYMLGNCSHCHNPNGFATVSTNWELLNALNFLPSDTGGIFEFPLDRTSKRIHRGESQTKEIAYITPSLLDLGKEIEIESVAASTANLGLSWTPRVTIAYDNDPNTAYTKPLLAPWRSLIYRNVDTPFTYVDDSAIFPHMPRHTPGYDCRVRQLLGTWMASIPARIPKLSSYPLDSKKGEFAPLLQEAEASGNETQPYVEVKRDDPEYPQAVRDAYYRVEDFKASPRYTDCPSPTLDIIDPNIRDNPGTVLAPYYLQVEKQIPGGTLKYSAQPPERAHWFVTDITDPPGDWAPRRADWQKVLVERDPKVLRLGEGKLVDVVSTIRLSGNDELNAFATTPFPLFIWNEKDKAGKACSFPKSVRTVGDIAAEQRPAWITAGMQPVPHPEGVYKNTIDGNAHVYEPIPGAYLFRQVCQNCHGPNADGRSRNADTIADLTGGDTRVANLRDGIFGPAAAPGTARAGMFGELAQRTQLSADDWAVRYLGWMTLGGTQRTIPPAILALVKSGDVFGSTHYVIDNTGDATSATANMLSYAKDLCLGVLPSRNVRFNIRTGTVASPLNPEPQTDPKDKGYDTPTLLDDSGDSEFWNRLCRLQNPLPVRVIKYGQSSEKGIFTTNAISSFDSVPGTSHRAKFDLYDRAGYGANRVGDQHGAIQNELTADNTAPWCIVTPLDAKMKASFEAEWSTRRGAGTPIPYCPQAMLDQASQWQWTWDRTLSWVERGAMNAAASVFLYLDALTKHKTAPAVAYDECDKLSTQ